MSTPTLDEARVKELFKEALVEVLAEQQDLLRRVVADIVEDIGLTRAIQEGEASPTVERDEVLRLLDDES